MCARGFIEWQVGYLLKRSTNVFLVLNVRLQIIVLLTVATSKFYHIPDFVIYTFIYRISIHRLIENGVCEAVMGYNDPAMRKKAAEYMSGKHLKVNEEKSAHVTDFLDRHFERYGDMAPEGRDVRTIQFTYRELYIQYYIPYCEDPLTYRACPVAETDFYRIR